MEETEVLNYVKAAAVVVGLSLDEARALQVAQHFTRTIAIARTLESAPLAPEHELAEVYRAAPFPAEDAA